MFSCISGLTYLKQKTCGVGHAWTIWCLLLNYEAEEYVPHNMCVIVKGFALSAASKVWPSAQYIASDIWALANTCLVGQDITYNTAIAHFRWHGPITRTLSSRVRLSCCTSKLSLSVTLSRSSYSLSICSWVTIVLKTTHFCACVHRCARSCACLCADVCMCVHTCAGVHV